MRTYEAVAFAGRSLRIMGLSAAMLVAGSDRVNAQCIFGAPFTVPGKAATVRLDVQPVDAGATATVLSLDVAACRLVLSPRRGAISTVLRITPQTSLTGDIRLQLRPKGSSMVFLSPSVLPLTNGTSGLVSVGTKRGDAEPVQVDVDAVVSDSNAPDSSYRATLRLVWAPEPVLTVHTTRSDCGTPLCFYAGSEEDVIVEGLDATDHAVDSVTVKDGNGVVTTHKLQSGPLGRFIRIQPSAGGGTFVVRAPLGRTEALALDGTRLDSIETSVRATVGVRPPARAIFRYDLGPGQIGAKLPWVHVGSPDVRVTLRIDEQGDATLKKLQFETPYPIREGFANSNSTPVAQFVVEGRSDSLAFGRLTPLVPTTSRPMFDSPRLTLQIDQATALATSFTVFPRAKVDRYRVERDHRAEEVAGAVSPWDSVKMHLEGPGVGSFVSGDFAGASVNRIAPLTRDTLNVSFVVPRTAHVMETMFLSDGYGATLPVSIPVAPAQRQRPLDSDWIEVRYTRDRSRLRAKPGSGESNESSTLQGVTMRLARDKIDTPDKAYGVQYLNVHLDLADATGKSRVTADKCYAVMPPSPSGVLYRSEGTCTPTYSDEIPLSGLIEQTSRATVASTLRVRISHDISQYADGDDTPAAEYVILRGGKMIFEPKYELPGPVFAFQHRALTPAINYAGAVLTFQPAGRLWTQWLGRSVTFESGFVLSTQPQASGSAVTQSATSAVLSLASGMNWVVKNMMGDVTLDFFGGYVAPFSGRGVSRHDGFFAFRPGFSIPLGGGAGAPVAANTPEATTAKP